MPSGCALPTRGDKSSLLSSLPAGAMYLDGTGPEVFLNHSHQDSLKEGPTAAITHPSALSLGFPWSTVLS